jgi:hypothetical protein
MYNPNRLEGLRTEPPPILKIPISTRGAVATEDDRSSLKLAVSAGDNGSAEDVDPAEPFTHAKATTHAMAMPPVSAASTRPRIESFRITDRRNATPQPRNFKPVDVFHWLSAH